MSLKNTIKTILSAIAKLSPKVASQVLYLMTMNRPLRLKNPKTFSEKLMKLKLDNYSHDPTVWRCVDKLQVRKYAKKKGVREKNLPTLLGIYDNANDIDFDILPDKFALKCTHGAGFNIICTDKSKLDEAETVATLNKWLSTPFGLSSAETHYGKAPPSIICEAFIEGEGDSAPNDYKIYCFSGKPLYVMACTERIGKLSKVNILDLNWQDTGYIKPNYSSNKKISPPQSLPEMLKMATKVSEEFPFVRVDFYEDKGVPILGEMTFTPHACVNSNMTEEGQIELGKLIDLDYSIEKEK